MKHAIEAGKVAAEAIQEIGEAVSEAAQSLSKSLEELTAENAETDYEKVLVQSRAQLTSIEGYSPEEANAALEEVHNLDASGKLFILSVFASPYVRRTWSLLFAIIFLRVYR